MEAEIIQAVLIEGAIGGAVLSAIAFLLSRFIKDIVGRTLLVTALFAAAGAYFGFAFNEQTPRVWLLIEFLQVIAYGTLGLYGWRGSPFWLALGWLLHPLWDFGLHYVGPGSSFTPLSYATLCISFDWVVAAYIFIAYRWLHLASRQAPSRAR
ncbi:MAG: hypothetical protein LC794_20600 [Acidobacteria bacterium]|nr:hypothetical protein [Acidobacteriota bacterium]